jgi:dipeptide/tripeptide permease
MPIIIGVLATAGYGVIALSPGEFKLARRLFWAAVSLALGLLIFWGISQAERTSVATTIHQALHKIEKRGTIERVAPQWLAIRWRPPTGV